MADKTSVHRAMFRNGLGWIDFVWRSTGRVKPSGKSVGAMGLSHIVEARQRKDGLSMDEAARLLDEIVETIARGQETKRVEFGGLVKVTLQREATEAVLTKRSSSMPGC
ncbi:putative barnase/colicin E5 family endoribonuclease [Azotobacter armeniacus]